MLNQSRNQLVFGVMVVLTAPCWLMAPVYAEILFGAPTQVPVEGVVSIDYPQISDDGLELYFCSEEPGRCFDIWVMRRPSADADWGTPVRLDPPINTAGPDTAPCISPDGLELYFSDENLGAAGCQPRPGGYGKADLWVSRRETKDAPWGEPQNLGPIINTAEDEDAPSLSADGLSMIFMSSLRADTYGTYDLYISTRASKNDPWGPARNLGAPINTGKAEVVPILSPDGLSLFFSDYYQGEVYVSRRTSLWDPWGAPIPFAVVQISGTEFSVNFCEADSTFYFANSATQEGVASLWKVEVMTIVDLNGDGRVDGTEIRGMAEHWGQDEPLYDIAPVPFRDNIVDVEDLKVLAEYVGKAVEDPTLVAHWAFDEAEGAVAGDRAGDYDATVAGGATWRPQGGTVGGALELDGASGCVLSKTIYGFAPGPFSAIAWVKGGAPGQVILSHGGTTDWLMANPMDGSLMTRLSGSGRSKSEGVSQAIITDGKWHRIALVWDGADRILYVDDREVARDPLPETAVPDGAFAIGARSDPNTLWSGLIDDVRIYSRVVRP